LWLGLCNFFLAMKFRFICVKKKRKRRGCSCLKIDPESWEIKRMFWHHADEKKEPSSWEKMNGLARHGKN